MQKEIRKADIKLPKDYNAKSLIELVAKHHEEISKYFFSGKGISLQYLDSEIALDILNYFIKKEILVLPVHDSFLIDSGYKDELSKVMIEAYKKRLKYKPRIEVKN